MKRYLSFAISLAAVGAASASCAMAATPAGGLAWDHDSLVTVTEKISALSQGIYVYSYSFTNTEPTGIWAIAVYTRFNASFITPFEGIQWRAAITPLDNVVPCYDARNLNPELAYMISAWSPVPPYPSQVSPISPGQAVTGFSFASTVYDPSSKPFYYELVGTYALDSVSRRVSAVGYTTVPEPSSILVLLSGVASLGGLVLSKNRKS